MQLLLPDAIRLAAVALGCLLGGLLGLEFSTHGTPPLMWPPAGLAFAAYLFLGWRCAPAVFAGLYAAAFLHGASPAMAVMSALPTTLAWLLVAGWLRSQKAFNLRPTGAENFPLGLAAACCGAALSALMVVGSLGMTEALPFPDLASAWLSWWAGEFQGALYFAPLVLGWAARPSLDRGIARLLPFALAMLVILATGMLMARNGAPGVSYLVWYALFCLALWPAAHFRLREVASFNVLIAATAFWALSAGFSPFPATADASLIAVHGFLTFLALTTLILAGLSADRRRAIRQAQASEARFRSLANLSADWVWEQDENFRFVYLSPGYQAATGRDPAKVLGTQPWDLPADNMAEADWEAHRELLHARRFFHSLLSEHRTDNGEIRYIETSGEPVFDAGGAFRGYRGIGHNVTTQKLAEHALHDSKRRLEDIIRASPQPITVNGMYSGCFHEANTAWELLLGYSREEVIGRTSFELGLWVNPLDFEAILAELRTQGSVAGAETSLRRKDGDIVDVLFAASSVDLGGEPIMLAQLVDITEMKRAERLLRQSEERFSTVFRSSPAAIAITRLEDGAYIDVNDAWQGLFGWSRDEILHAKVGLLDIWADPDERKHVLKALAGGERVRDREARFYLRSGAIADVLLSAEVIDFSGDRYALACMVDITERKRSVRRIEELATRDPLTGLPNRLLLADRLSQGIANARRQNELMAVVFIDLDHFKQINDSRGHAAGDMFLKEVAARIGDILRRGDTLARLGGDEFVVVLEGLKQAADAGQVAQKIIRALSEPFELSGSMINSSASLGVSLFPSDGTDGAALMRNADKAMYFAKDDGRNCYRFFQWEMHVKGARAS